MARNKSNDSSEPDQAAAEPSQEETAAAETTADTAAVENAGDAAEQHEGTDSSGDQAAAEPSQEEAVAPDPDASRTGFAEPGLRAGDQCICPDGQAGTVARFGAELVCLRNQG